jgi:DNA-binding winged helix-turn-helix (wHTH) protein/tetratricopeptide (TPR) repeat protein
MISRFGIFELDLESGDLRKGGRKIRLADQPFRVLRILLERPGHVVSREDLQCKLWPGDTFVDSDLGLNSAIRKLRDALGDSAESPRFIETVPRRGYRFIAPLNAGDVVNAPDRAVSWPRVAAVIVVGAAVIAAVQQNFRGPVVRAVAPQAYTAYVKGVRETGLQTYDGFRQAVVYFEEAIARQPDFARAHAALAEAQMQFLFVGPLSPREAVPRAEVAARKAVELQPDLPEGHRILAAILRQFYWRADESDRELQRARELGGGNDASGDGWLPLAALLRQGRAAEAIAEAERLRRIDPNSLNANLAVARAYRAAGQYENAAAAIRHVFDVGVTRPRAHFQLGATLATMGRFDDASREFEVAVRTSPQRNPRFEAYLGYVLAAAGREPEARAVLSDLESLGAQQYVSSFGLALIHDALGERDRALEAVERAYQDRAVEFSQWSNLYPSFKTIASEPRFLALVDKIRSIL